MAPCVSGTVKQSQAMALKEQKVNPTKMITGLRRKWLDEEDNTIDWEGLGQSCAMLSDCVPRVEFLCGAIERQEKKRARKERESKSTDLDEEEAEEVSPENITEKAEDLIESTEQRIQVFTSRFKDVSKQASAAASSSSLASSSSSSKVKGDEYSELELFPFVVDPQSFTQTVGPTDISNVSLWARYPMLLLHLVLFSCALTPTAVGMFLPMDSIDA